MEQQAVERVFTIQEMAQATRLSAHTLRYYERAGLMLQRIGRDEGNGYRFYSQEDLDWVEFLKRLRATGMPIRDIQRYTNLLRQGEETIPERLQLLKQHQRRVEEHLKESERHLEVITFKIDCYEQLHTQHKTASWGEYLLEPGDE
ncbi:MerR family transcriptional regulator [Dictyobacter sp. S3.2.2.5]|uniref:MerR family transcriptional regulator n=1 Tax=Dictyobacter halimunensis TaxID=3026934 RepID=A0ABQ6FRB8_9CHLR|nr:MerR family transcriptional regulator [Dictyobacter sp. S3.2.2.5]